MNIMSVGLISHLTVRGYKLLSKEWRERTLRRQIAADLVSGLEAGNANINGSQSTEEPEEPKGERKWTFYRMVYRQNLFINIGVLWRDINFNFWQIAASGIIIYYLIQFIYQLLYTAIPNV
jgi:hypothetical protein